MTQSKQAKPWLQWPHDLPAIDEVRLTPEYALLRDENNYRTMIQHNRDRLLNCFQSSVVLDVKSAIVLQGGSSGEWDNYDQDITKCEFRQESYFQWLFGINEPDCYGLVDLVDGSTHLFVPEVSCESERWNGTRRPLSYYSQRYGVTHTHINTQMQQVLQTRGIHKLFVLHGYNRDSGIYTTTTAKFSGIDNYSVDTATLHPIMERLRMIKSKYEIDILRIGCLISSQAHVYVMRHIYAGMMELQCEANFKAWCAWHGGSRHCAYTCICGSGENGSVLHYGHAGRPNDRVLSNGDTIVNDMGAEFNGYATDITRSYPINGVFTPDQKLIHNAVVDAQLSVIRAIKPGVFWPDMHQLAERVIITHLRDGGLLHNGSVDEMLSAHLGAVFMPHGLGHLLGMNVHDVGGYEAGTSKASTPGICYLRLGRALEAGMVLTVEPGIYFNQPTLDKALNNPSQARFLNLPVLSRFFGSGGCRMEDDVLVTESGCENFTVLPTTVEEIEQVIQHANQLRNNNKNNPSHTSFNKPL